jgi:hypothetical protein
MNTKKYEHVTLQEIKDRAFKHADEVVTACTKHSETLKNCKSPKEVLEHCNHFENLMTHYQADTAKILKELEKKTL